MSYLHFFNVLLSNFAIYCLIGISVLLFVYLFSKIQYFTIFDPYILNIFIPFTFSLSVILFLLWYTKSIWYLKVLFVDFAFFIGIRVGRRKYCCITNEYKKNNRFFYSFYIANTFLFFCVSALYIVKVGKSAWTNKLSYNQGNGFIVLLKDGLLLFEIFLVIIKREFYKKDIKDFLILFFCLILVLLNGSKSIIVSFFSYIIFEKVFININFKKKTAYSRELYLKQKNKFSLKLAAISFPMLLIPFFFMTGTIRNAFFSLLRRFVDYGDVYFLGIESVIEKLPKYTFGYTYIYPIFRPIISRLGILNPEPALGLEISKIVFSLSDPTTGPNPRFDYMLLLTTNFVIAMIISFMMGFFVHRIRFLKKSKISTLYLLTILFFLFKIGALMTSYNIFINSVHSYLFVMIILIPLTYLIDYSTRGRNE